MRRSLWPAYNVAGVLYNPFSIANALRLLLLEDNPYLPDNTIINNEGLWHSLLFDSGFSDLSKDKLLEKFNEKAIFLRERMQEGADIVITFGTAWIYTLVNDTLLSGNVPYIVGNCHKLPAKYFERSLLTPPEISSVWIELLLKLPNKYPDLRIIFTLSPVRHIKDGMSGNSLSKSILRISIEDIIKAFENRTNGGKERVIQEKASYCSNINTIGNIDYFPAFEILTDDLRDYRFYASDLVHPSDEAIEYISGKFFDRYVNEEDCLLMKQGLELFKGFRHKPIIPVPAKQEEYFEKLSDKWASLRTVWPEALNPTIS